MSSHTKPGNAGLFFQQVTVHKKLVKYGVLLSLFAPNKTPEHCWVRAECRLNKMSSTDDGATSPINGTSRPTGFSSPALGPPGKPHQRKWSTLRSCNDGLEALDGLQGRTDRLGSTTPSRRPVRILLNPTYALSPTACLVRSILEQ